MTCPLYSCPRYKIYSKDFSSFVFLHSLLRLSKDNHLTLWRVDSFFLRDIFSSFLFHQSLVCPRHALKWFGRKGAQNGFKLAARRLCIDCHKPIDGRPGRRQSCYQPLSPDLYLRKGFQGGDCDCNCLLG